MQLELFTSIACEQPVPPVFSTRDEYLQYSKALAQRLLWSGRLSPKEHAVWKRTHRLPCDILTSTEFAEAWNKQFHS